MSMTTRRTETSTFTSTIALTTAAAASIALAAKVDSVIRQGDPVWDCPTHAKMQRAGLYTLASLIPIATSKLSNDPSATVFSLVGSVASIFLASKIRDYQDPKECVAMQREDQNLSFAQLKEKHGLENLTFLQLPIQEKFRQFYQAKDFSQILKENSFEDITRFRLAPLTVDGFLHDKLIEELRSNKLHFLSRLSLDGNIEKILSNRMFAALFSLNQRSAALPNLARIVDEISSKYPQRTEIQNVQFTDKERNIPTLARAYGKIAAQTELRTIEIDQEFRTLLNRIDERYPDRTEKLAARYEERQKKITETSRKVGADTKNAFLNTGRVTVGNRNMGPQSVSATIASATREPIGGRVYSPQNPDVERAAENAGVNAERSCRVNLQTQLDEEFKILAVRGRHSQAAYEAEVKDAYRVRDASYASLKGAEDQYTNEEQKRLIEELQGEKDSLRNQGILQQKKYEQEVAAARNDYQDKIRILENELEQILRF